MDTPPQSETSTTLLARLQQAPADPAAWQGFVQRYGPRIVGWCRQWGLQEADAQDVSQAVLLKLLSAMRQFEYQPSQRFRAWLKTVTHHAWQDLVRGRRRLRTDRQSDADDPLEKVAARDDLTTGLQDAYEQELLEQALARVRLRVQAQTWDAFRLTALEGVSGAEAAARLGLPVTSVYKAKSNVKKLLEAEVRYLEGGES
jgi:RNA polymerase sigma-70 factor (ECF subfamily)